MDIGMDLRLGLLGAASDVPKKVFTCYPKTKGAHHELQG